MPTGIVIFHMWEFYWPTAPYEQVSQVSLQAPEIGSWALANGQKPVDSGVAEAQSVQVKF
jgi:hypothetical protein